MQEYFVVEERYHFVISLYRIQKMYRRMGIFAHPEFVWKIFNPLLGFELNIHDRTDADIYEAVKAWNYNSVDTVKVEKKYGHISKWNTSRVTNMESLFRKTHFNGDISNWNVRNVTNMQKMFFQNDTFNGDLSKWNVGNVKDMNHMFYQAAAYVGGNTISSWNVSKVTNTSAGNET